MGGCQIGGTVPQPIPPLVSLWFQKSKLQTGLRYQLKMEKRVSSPKKHSSKHSCEPVQVSECIPQRAHYSHLICPQNIFPPNTRQLLWFSERRHTLPAEAPSSSNPCYLYLGNLRQPLCDLKPGTDAACDSTHITHTHINPSG